MFCSVIGDPEYPHLACECLLHSLSEATDLIAQGLAWYLCVSLSATGRMCGMTRELRQDVPEKSKLEMETFHCQTLLSKIATELQFFVFFFFFFAPENPFLSLLTVRIMTATT